MTKWLFSRLKTKTAWKLITFTGPSGGESVGIVDILAVRKDHRIGQRGLKRGDLLDIILVQVKGGTACSLCPDDINRLRLVVGDTEQGRFFWPNGNEVVSRRFIA